MYANCWYTVGGCGRCTDLMCSKPIPIVMEKSTRRITLTALPVIGVFQFNLTYLGKAKFNSQLANLTKKL
jgi:hypothetical protein